MAKKQKLPGEPAHAGQLPEVDQIDLGAALPAQVPEAQPPRRGPGRPRSTTPKPPKTQKPRKTRKDKGIKKPPKTPYIDNNNILVTNEVIRGDNINNIDDMGDMGDKTDFLSASDYKEKLTGKEWKFLSLYLSGSKTMLNSMKSAGYRAAQDTYLFLLAKKILIKYESQTEDHRIIFRAMGAGEVFVANGLIELAKTSKSDMVRLNAYAQIAKILGLTKEQLEGAGGVTIIFEGSTSGPAALPGGPPGLPPGSPSQPAALPAPAKAIMVTK